MHKRSIRFSILLIILTLFLGFGVSFVAPKPVKAGALEDFVTRLTLGDFIRGLFEGLFGGTRGADAPYACEFTNLGDCTPNCTGGTCTNTGCGGDTYKCVPRPTNTPAPTRPAPTPGCSMNACGAGSCPSGQGCVLCDNSKYRCGPLPTNTPRPTVTPTPGCSMNACGAGSCPSGQGCVLCDNSKYRCGTLPTNTPRPTATITVRPTATSVPRPPTVTVGPGTPSPTPAPSYTPVPYPTEPPGTPGATATPTTSVGAPCYYNVKLVSKDTGTALPSALQTGVTEAGGCRTAGVRELVPSFFTQPSSATNQPEWPCTDATYVGEQCTQGIVTGQFICMGGPSHEIKGCYNRTSDAYQRVSIVSVGITPPVGTTSTPTQPVATPTPAYVSFSAWFTVFRSYVDGPAGGMSVSLTQLEDWRNNIPLPAPTRP